MKASIIILLAISLIAVLNLLTYYSNFPLLILLLGLTGFAGICGFLAVKKQRPSVWAFLCGVAIGSIAILFDEGNNIQRSSLPFFIPLLLVSSALLGAAFVGGMELNRRGHYRLGSTLLILSIPVFMLFTQNAANQDVWRRNFIPPALYAKLAFVILLGFAGYILFSVLEKRKIKSKKQEKNLTKEK